MVKLDYELPQTVKSIRDGWQWTSSSGAVVSGLLAAAAAQLLGYFKGDSTFQGLEPRDQNLVLIHCYSALFLNISATISSFILTDNLGELEYKAAVAEPGSLGSTDMNSGRILKYYGATSQWNPMLFHWLATFYFGILSLIIAVLSFVWLAESRTIAITMTVIVAATLLPVTHFILIRPLWEGYKKDRKERIAEMQRYIPEEQPDLFQNKHYKIPPGILDKEAQSPVEEAPASF